MNERSIIRTPLPTIFGDRLFKAKSTGPEWWGEETLAGEELANGFRRAVRRLAVWVVFGSVPERCLVRKAMWVEQKNSRLDPLGSTGCRNQLHLLNIVVSILLVYKVVACVNQADVKGVTTIAVADGGAISGVGRKECSDATIVIDGVGLNQKTPAII